MAETPSPTPPSPREFIDQSATWLRDLGPLLKPAFAACSVLGGIYVFRFCEHYGVPFPASYGDLLRLIALVFALAAYGMLMLGLAAVLPAILPRALFQSRSEYFYRFVVPLSAGAAAFSVPANDFPTVADITYLVCGVLVALAICTRLRQRRYVRWAGRSIAFWTAVSLGVNFVWLSLLTTLMAIAASAMPDDLVLDLIVVWSSYAACFLVLYIILCASRRLRRRSFREHAARTFTALAMMLVMVALIPSSVAPEVTRQALNALGIGGNLPIQLSAKAELAKTGIPALGISSSSTTSCSAWLVFETSSTYFVRGSTSLTEPLIALPSSDVAFSIRGNDSRSRPCPPVTVAETH